MDLNLQKGEAVLIKYQGYTGDDSKIDVLTYNADDVFDSYEIVQVIENDGYGDNLLIINEKICNFPSLLSGEITNGIYC